MLGAIINEAAGEPRGGGGATRSLGDRPGKGSTRQ
jgi:hypothetical protein